MHVFSRVFFTDRGRTIPSITERLKGGVPDLPAVGAGGGGPAWGGDGITKIPDCSAEVGAVPRNQSELTTELSRGRLREAVTDERVSRVNVLLRSDASRLRFVRCDTDGSRGGDASLRFVHAELRA